MAHYGHILDSTYDPRKEEVYSIFSEYFGNPTMTKIKNIGEYSMYMVKIQAQLGIEFRYLIIFVYKDTLVVGRREQLSKLSWVSLQTRTLTDNHDIIVHSYNPRRLQGLMKTINLTTPNTGKYIYKVEDLPLTVTLLPKEKDGDNQYTSSGTIVTALETYQTIINFM